MRGKPFRFADFREGVNLRDAAYLLDEGERFPARDARNVVGSQVGAIRKRYGCPTFATIPAAPTGLYPLQAVGPYLIVTAGNGHVYSIDETGAVVDRYVGADPLVASQWTQARPSGGQGPLYGLAYRLAGGPLALQWDGVAGSLSAWTASAGTLPLGRYVVSMGNRVWVAGTAADRSRLYFSQLDDPRDWPVENVVDFDSDDGGEITGLGTVGPYLLVFKQRKAYVVYDLDTGANRALSNGLGCSSHRSIVETPKGTFFLTADRGIWATDGSRLWQVSQAVSPIVQAAVPPGTISGSALTGFAAAATFNDRYYLSLAAEGYGNLTLDLDLQTDAWWVHSNAEVEWAVFTASDAAELYGAKGFGPTVRKAYVAGVYQDEGASFTSYWRGPWHAFGNEHVRKRVRQVRLDGSGSFDVRLAKDFGEASITSPVALGSSTGFGQVLTPGVAKVWSVEVGESSAAGWELDSYVILLAPRKD